MIEPLEPLIVDLTLEDLGLDMLDASMLEDDILLPAMEAAIARMVAEDEDLARGLPPLPTQLESVVDEVMSIVQENNVSQEFRDIEGSTDTEWATSSLGLITDLDDLLSAIQFSEYSPSVFWVVDDDCLAAGGSCNVASDRSDQWKDLQRKAIGTLFYKVNEDDVPEIHDKYVVESAPSFLVVYGDDIAWNTKIGEN